MQWSTDKQHLLGKFRRCFLGEAIEALSSKAAGKVSEVKF